jgi:hypothetical protein
MAGFEVTLYGRFWVTPEVSRRIHWATFSNCQNFSCGGFEN